MEKAISLILLIIAFLLVFEGRSQTAAGGSLSLGSAIETGLKNNPEIKSAAEKINASRGGFWSAISPVPVDLSITNDYIPSGQRLNAYGEKTIGVSQSIDFPTNYLFRGSKSVIARKIAENEFALAKLGVISTIKKSYYKVVALQEQVRVSLRNLAIARDFVKKAEVRHTVGEGTNLERLTAKVNYTEALNSVEVQKNHLAIAVAELNLSMGYGKGESINFTLSDTLAFIPFKFTLNQLADEAAVINPLLKVNKLRVDSYSVDKSLAWSSILPYINLACFTKEVRDDAQNYYGVSFSIGIPLWFLLDQRGKIMEASSNISVAKSDLQASHNAVYAKTQDAYAEFKHGESQVKLYVYEIIPQAEEIYRTAAKSYEAGEITYIEFLQAQQTLINSRGSYIDALLSYNLSIITIEESIGKTLQ
jgi:cobalt-zinc-cadmium resistance protein CzcA